MLYCKRETHTCTLTHRRHFSFYNISTAVDINLVFILPRGKLKQENNTVRVSLSGTQTDARLALNNNKKWLTMVRAKKKIYRPFGRLINLTNGIKFWTLYTFESSRPRRAPAQLPLVFSVCCGAQQIAALKVSLKWYSRSILLFQQN